VERIEKENAKYKEEGESVNKMLHAFSEKNEQRIFKHERLLPYLNEIRNYLNFHNSIKNITEEIQREEPELENKRRAVNDTLNAISKLTGQKVEMTNAIKVLTDFRDRVIFYTTKKINAEDALSQQKNKICKPSEKAKSYSV